MSSSLSRARRLGARAWRSCASALGPFPSAASSRVGTASFPSLLLALRVRVPRVVPRLGPFPAPRDDISHGSRDSRRAAFPRRVPLRPPRGRPHLLHHRARRPRQIHPRRPPHGAHRRGPLPAAANSTSTASPSSARAASPSKPRPCPCSTTAPARTAGTSSTSSTPGPRGSPWSLDRSPRRRRAPPRGRHAGRPGADHRHVLPRPRTEPHHPPRGEQSRHGQRRRAPRRRTDAQSVRGIGHDDSTPSDRDDSTSYTPSSDSTPSSSSDSYSPSADGLIPVSAKTGENVRACWTR